MTFKVGHSGVALMEAILAIAIVGLVVLSHARAQIMNQEIYNRNRRNLLAMQQAEDLMEQYSSMKFDDLSNSNDLTQNNYLYNGIRFNRVVDITAGSNASVTIAVTVTSTTSGHSGSAALTKKFAFVNSR